VTDERPKPKYGELAPPGWVWKPPTDPDADAPDAGDTESGVGARGTTSSGSGAASTTPPAPGDADDRARASWPAPTTPPQAPRDTRVPDARAQPGEQPAAPRTLLGGDIAITVILLSIGFLITASWVPFLLDLAGSIQLYLSQQDLGTYTADDVARSVGTVGAVLQVLLLATATTLAVFRIRAGKRAFFIPLAAGVVGIIITFTCTAIALASDEALMSSLTRVSGG
jgi:hypothetical protein